MTLLWMVLGILIVVTVQSVAMAPLAAIRLAGARREQFHELIARIESDGLMLAVATLASAPVMAFYTAMIAKLTRLPVQDYLGLNSVSRRTLIVSLGVIAGYIVVVDTCYLLMGRPVVPEFSLETYRSAGFVPLLAVALVVAAPMWEELFFRGLVWQGWARSPLGPIGASLLTSLCWTTLHIQYGWLELTTIFICGVVLGLIRWKSGSVLLTMVLHAVQNLVAFLETVVAVELLGK